MPVEAGLGPRDDAAGCLAMKMPGQTDAREAVQAARQCVAEFFADKVIQAMRLEEEVFDENPPRLEGDDQLLSA